MMFKLELWLRQCTVEVADRLRTKMLDALADTDASKPGSRPKMPEFEYKKRK